MEKSRTRESKFSCWWGDLGWAFSFEPHIDKEDQAMGAMWNFPAEICYPSVWVHLGLSFISLTSSSTYLSWTVNEWNAFLK